MESRLKLKAIRHKVKKQESNLAKLRPLMNGVQWAFKAKKQVYLLRNLVLVINRAEILITPNLENGN